MIGVNRMQLDDFYLKNYRGINRLHLQFNGKTTIFYGINGVGKSSIVRGINTILSEITNTIISKEEFVKTRPHKADIKIGEKSLVLAGLFKFEDTDTHRLGIIFPKDLKKNSEYDSDDIRFASYNDEKGKTDLENFTKPFVETYLGNNDGALPIFAYYGVNRAAVKPSNTPAKQDEGPEFSKIDAYKNSFDESTDFSSFFQWFLAKEDDKTDEGKRALSIVCNAITNILKDFSNIRVQSDPLCMIAEKSGTVLSIQQLSDGEKCALALFGDIARRLVIANPKSEDPLSCPGIVTIDEVELHMHPAWQWTVVSLLRTTFPNIQFFITTHSPQVIGSLNNEVNVFGVDRVDGEVCVTQRTPAYYDANYVLESEMEVPSVDPAVKELESEIATAISEKDLDIDGVIKNIDRLRAMTNDTSPLLARMDILMTKFGR